MKYVFLFLAFLLVSVTFAEEPDRVDFTEFGCLLLIDDLWSIDNQTTDEINLTHKKYPSAQLIIRKHILAKENQIKSESELSSAITGLYRELGVELAPSDHPEYFLKQNRVVFFKEYTTKNPETGSPLRIILKGIIVRSDSHGQVLYLLQAQVPADYYSRVFAQITATLDSFQLTEPILETLYPSGYGSTIIIFFVVIVLMGFFFMRNRRVQRSANPLGGDSKNFWRCPSCNRINHTANLSCHRCGYQKTGQHTR
jgi:hypothetical protein